MQRILPHAKMQVLDKGWYLKLIVKEHKKTQTEESIIDALTSCNKIDKRVLFQAKFYDVTYEYMNVQNKRFRTFMRCEPAVTPKKALELAESGFFYVRENIIQCRYCLQLFNDWMNWEDVYEEHEYRVPNCPIVHNGDIDNLTPSYKSVKDVPNQSYCGYYSECDHVYPTLNGYQIGEDGEKDRVE